MPRIREGKLPLYTNEDLSRFETSGDVRQKYITPFEEEGDEQIPDRPRDDDLEMFDRWRNFRQKYIEERFAGLDPDTISPEEEAEKARQGFLRNVIQRHGSKTKDRNLYNQAVSEANRKAVLVYKGMEGRRSAIRGELDKVYSSFISDERGRRKEIRAEERKLEGEERYQERQKELIRYREKVKPPKKEDEPTYPKIEGRIFEDWLSNKPLTPQQQAIIDKKLTDPLWNKSVAAVLADPEGKYTTSEKQLKGIEETYKMLREAEKRKKGLSIDAYLETYSGKHSQKSLYNALKEGGYTDEQIGKAWKMRRRKK